MVDETLEHQTHGMTGRSLCLVLFATYVALSAYGVWAAVVEIPTFVVVGSATFAVVWASVVSILAALAAVGVARTWRRGRYRLEKYTTSGFVIVFLGYSFALIYRSWDLNDWDNAPLALIPVVLCILPAVRYFDLVRRGPHRFGYPRVKKRG